MHSLTFNTIIYDFSELGRCTFTLAYISAIIQRNSPNVLSAVDCGPLPTVPGSRLLPQTTHAVVMYECIEHTRLISGDIERHCLETGTWNGTSPVCQGM